MQQNEIEVKRWGPLTAVQLAGRWRHFCLTLRFGRVFSSTDSLPDALIAQSYLFIDGKRVQEDEAVSFDPDVSTSARLTTGLTHILYGGSDPSSSSSSSSTYQYFTGSMSNLRVWWPACPPKDDPSRCNPYAFSYSRLQDGSPFSSAFDPRTGEIITVMCFDTLLSSVLTLQAGGYGRDLACGNACVPEHALQVGEGARPRSAARGSRIQLSVHSELDGEEQR
eukprot:765270-Hanusia_phi.AAC.4